MRLPIRKTNLCAALCLASALPAIAQPPALDDGTPIRADDVVRLDHFDASAGAGLLDMLAVAPEADRDAVVAALTGQPKPAEEAMHILAGEWSCQVMKLGGDLGALVYQPFKCRADGNGNFEKLTGSQRTKGTIHRHGERLVYLGTGFIHDDPNPPSYADLPVPTDPQSIPQRVPNVGLVQVISEKRGRILFPDPELESTFDILLLTR